ncbi:MAG: diguanylate cyclase [Thermoleophilia bacterium]|nr:diguanylate cyclase [Thermoleophilia bacterium]
MPATGRRSAPLRVLLIESDPGTARWIGEALASRETESFEVEWVRELVPGLDRLGEGAADVCVLDLSLGGSAAARTVLAARVQAPDTPVIVLAAEADEELAAQAVAEGAHDYLVREQLHPDLVAWGITQAAYRARRSPRFEQARMLDELTGVLNGRGLAAVGERQVRVAAFTRRPFAVLYVDVDGLATINERHGRAAGDRVVLDVVTLLAGTFRASDVIARVGGDELCVILCDVTLDGFGEERAQERLAEALARLNARRDEAPAIALTIGASRLDPAQPCTFDQLLRRARHAMRDRKLAAA